MLEFQNPSISFSFKNIQEFHFIKSNRNALVKNIKLNLQKVPSPDSIKCNLSLELHNVELHEIPQLLFHCLPHNIENSSSKTCPKKSDKILCKQFENFNSHLSQKTSISRIVQFIQRLRSDNERQILIWLENFLCTNSAYLDFKMYQFV